MAYPVKLIVDLAASVQLNIWETHVSKRIFAEIFNVKMEAHAKMNIMVMCVIVQLDILEMYVLVALMTVLV